MTQSVEAVIRQDPLIVKLLEQLPEHLQRSFSDEQLAALKETLSGEKWSNHPVDLRDSFGIFNWRYYFVLVAGRDRRQRPERRYKILGYIKLLLFLGYLISSTLLGLLALYLIKSAYGINIFSGFSLGIWGWFKHLTCN